MKRVLLLMIVALAVGVLAQAAHAGLMALSLSDGINPTVTVADGDAADLNVLTGAITYSGTIGDWIVNVTTGLSNPILGDNEIDLNSVNVSTNNGGTMTIMLTDTDLTGSGDTLVSSIGGTTEGTITLTQKYDPTNAQWGTGATPATTLYSGPLVGGAGDAFAWADSTSVPFASLFSLTEVVTIAHAVGPYVDTSFDAKSKVVPVPGAVLLGILGLGVAGLKLRKFA